MWNKNIGQALSFDDLPLHAPDYLWRVNIALFDTPYRQGTPRTKRACVLNLHTIVPRVKGMSFNLQPAWSIGWLTAGPHLVRIIMR